jgi:hypothetical protein
MVKKNALDFQAVSAVRTDVAEDVDDGKRVLVLLKTTNYSGSSNVVVSICPANNK